MCHEDGGLVEIWIKTKKRNVGVERLPLFHIPR
jgi:hypothetical protein